MIVLDFLLIMCAILLVGCFVMVLYIMYLKLQHNSKEKIKENIMIRHKNDMYDYLAHNNFQITLKPRKRYIVAFENMLYEFSYLITGVQVKKNIREYSEKYFTDYYRVLLNEKNWANKVNALNGIVQFNISTLTEEVALMFHNEKIRGDKIISSLILKILLLNNEQTFLKLYNQYKIDISTSQFRQLCKEFSDSQWDYIIDNFETLSYEWKLSTIECIGLFNKVRHEKFIEQYVASHLYNLREETLKQLNLNMHKHEHVLSDIQNIKSKREKKILVNNLIIIELENEGIKKTLSEQNEMIVKCLKTLTIIGHRININALKPYYYSSIWEERLMVIKIIGKMGLVNKQLFIIECLSDDNFYVRKEAIKSLAAIQGDLHVIKQLYYEIDDEIAKVLILELIEGSGIHV